LAAVSEVKSIVLSMVRSSVRRAAILGSH
jgi:hypothetical protein